MKSGHSPVRQKDEGPRQNTHEERHSEASKIEGLCHLSQMMVRFKLPSFLPASLLSEAREPEILGVFFI